MNFFNIQIADRIPFWKLWFASCAFFSRLQELFFKPISLYLQRIAKQSVTARKNAYFFKPFNGFSRKPSRLFGTENILSSSDFFSRPDFRRAKKTSDAWKIGAWKLFISGKFFFWNFRYAANRRIYLNKALQPVRYTTPQFAERFKTPSATE